MSSARPRRAGRRRSGWGCAVLLLIAVFVLPPVFQRGAEEETIPDPRRVIPDDRNARAALVEAIDGVTASSSPAGYPDPSPLDNPLVLQFLADHNATLVKIDAALALPEFVWRKQAAEDLRSTRHPEWSQVRSAARLKVQRGHLRLARGDTAGGLRDYLDVIELGRRAARGGGSLMEYLVGYAIEAIGERAVREALGPAPSGAEGEPTRQWPRSGWSPEDRRLWAAARDRLLSWDEEPAAVKEALCGEYQLSKELYLEPERGGLSGLGGVPTLLYLPHETVALLRGSVSELLRQADLPATERNLSRAAVARPEGLELLSNPVGKTLVASTYDSLAKVLDKAEERRAFVRVTAASIAVKLYLEDHGQLASTWTELEAGGYLPKAPLDPYTGDPLANQPSVGRIYSFGPNRRDDGGVLASARGFDDAGDVLYFVTVKP